ncbi:hypothetical protein [Azospirillum picis]|uniref:RNA recognition motif-containing protein n=1 Tax=Azospirillum picis TaxID=488438 RepID=A0ABU0MP57_9PROT|nr:hypothetical protein [Azospirillum picis]MBP2301422.1 RNA recognition motif-containing protein [Azospirillum picis]MDQ0535253.1 RNA recognition motif-containing protein [Azospirillum picis]
MASIMIKKAGEGLVSKAHRSADVGPTSGSSVVYEIQNVPADVSEDDVIAAFKTYKPVDKVYEIEWAELSK